MQRSAIKEITGNLLLMVILLLLAPGIGRAATGCDGAGNCYVRSGATGSGSGTDWANAYTNLPASLARGVIYYVAAGTYPPHVFNDAVSGSTLITIKAPTIANHGTSTGWSNSYQGQALWQCTSTCGPIWDVHLENYIIFDGSYSTPLSPYTNIATSGYGFKLKTNGYGGNGNTGNNCSECGVVRGGVGYNNLPNLGPGTYNHDLTFKYIEIEGNHQSSDTGLADAGFDFEGGSYNLLFSHLYIHHATWDYFLRGDHNGQSNFGPGNNITVEYNYMYWDYTDQGSGQGPHGTPCACSEGLKNFAWRYNVIADMVGTNSGPDTASGADYNTGNGPGGPWYIYGNIWYADTASHCAVGDGTLSIYDFSMTAGDLWFVNNSNVKNGYPFCSSTDEVTYGIGIGLTTPMHGWYEENNLWYQSDLGQNLGSDIIQNGITSGGTQGSMATFSPATVHGYDAYFASPNTAANDNDTYKQVSAANPFVNLSGNDFRLVSDTTAGVTLTNTGTYWNGSTTVPNTFNVDMNGVTRGASGTWDRGALQVPSSAQPNPPTSLTGTPH